VSHPLDVTLQDLALPSGALAMLAIDQRESLRNMFIEALGHDDVPDAVLTDFKVAIAEELAGSASAILMDRLYGRAAFDTIGATRSCGLIVAADHLVQPSGSAVVDTAIDPDVDLGEAREHGAVGAKLLVLWRGDNERECRELVDQFLERCEAARLLSVVEAIVKPTAGAADWSREDAIVEAAERLASGADLYKCEIPFLGDASSDAIQRESERVTDAIDCPWVVLSSGVPAARFPFAVEAACKGGASGFLAGRAIWADTVAPGDYRARIRRDSIPRMAAMTDIVNEHARPWRAASGAATTG
jgi:sulfofructosephosphate aldolase